MRKRKEFLTFASPLIEDPEIKEIVSVLRSGWIGTGPKVRKFEEMFAQYKASKCAVALGSATAALHLAMRAMQFKPPFEVIVPAMTFAATANAVIHAGGTPVLADCCRDTMNIDPQEIKRKITPRTKAVIPVHFAGRPAQMDDILSLAKRYGLKVLEDCAHAIEANFQGKKTGTMGDAGCFSFYVTKNITTGEGGMVLTENQAYADKIKILALHGMSNDAWRRYSDRGFKHYQVVDAGFKSNMTDIQAAMGIHQLPRIEQYWRIREKQWNTYNRAFQGLPVGIPRATPSGSRHAYHLYTLLLDKRKAGISRDDFLEEMTRRNIGIGVHYIALHLHPYYRKTYGYKRGDFPNAEWISQRTVSLPLSPKLSSSDIADVIEAVKAILVNRRKQSI